MRYRGCKGVDVMKCNKCNHILPDDSEFCQYCGEIIEIEKETAEKEIIKEDESLQIEIPKTIIKEKAKGQELSKVEKGYKYLELKQWKKASELFELSIVDDENVALAYTGKLLAKFKLSDIESLTSKSKNLNKYDDFKLAKKYADEEYEKSLEHIAEICNNKLKRCYFRLAVTFASVVLVCVLTILVFIPFGRYFWYSSLLSDTKIEKAVDSYKNSDFLEYVDLNKGLFYEKGIELLGNKDYKNAETCFGAINKYKDSKNYYNYCRAQKLLANGELESYDYFKKCGDFLDSQQILETNKYFKLVEKLQGEWYYPGITFEQERKEMIESGNYYEDPDDRGHFYFKENFSSYQEFLNFKEGGNDSSGVFEFDPRRMGVSAKAEAPETILISGGKNLRIVEDSIVYKSGSREIRIIDNNTITILSVNLGGFIEFTRQK